jgi:4'-phosphopantetheinyl transferase
MPFNHRLPSADLIDIWRFDLDAPEDDIGVMTCDLTQAERSRALRYVNRRDADRFIVGRAMLRRILGWYTATPARRIHLGVNAFGKPHLVSHNEPPLQFNLSHSRCQAALAVSAYYPVGIDIEAIAPLKENVAAHFFSAAECAALDRCNEEDKLAAFYRCWTRKEAFVKAHGAGLSLPLDSFDVTVADGVAPVLERLDGDPHATENWRLLHLEAASQFTGAVAALTVGNAVSLRYRMLAELDPVPVFAQKVIDQAVNLASSM